MSNINDKSTTTRTPVQILHCETNHLKFFTMREVTASAIPESLRLRGRTKDAIEAVNQAIIAARVLISEDYILSANKLKL